MPSRLDGGQLVVDAAAECSEFTCINEGGVFAAVAEAAFGGVGFASRQEPETDGDLHTDVELAGEGDRVVLRFSQDLRDGLGLKKCGIVIVGTRLGHK
jgi:hypothetical protein